MRSVAAGVRGKDSKWNIVYERVLLPIRKRKKVSRDASRAFKGVVKLQQVNWCNFLCRLTAGVQDIRAAAAALDATLRSLAACTDDEVFGYVRVVHDKLKAQKRVPVIQPFNTLMKHLIHCLQKKSHLDSRLAPLIAEITIWILKQFYEGNKIWRTLFIPLMIDCVVTGLRCGSKTGQFTVVDQWLSAGLVLVQVT